MEQMDEDLLEEKLTEKKNDCANAWK